MTWIMCRPSALIQGFNKISALTLLHILSIAKAQKFLDSWLMSSFMDSYDLSPH